MFRIRPAQVLETEQMRAREDLIKRQEQINTEGDAIAALDEALQEDGQALEDHKQSFFWFQSTEAGSVGFYWVILIAFGLLCFVDVAFIGLAATESIVKAIILPLAFLAFETLLLCYMEYKLIELGGSVWPVDVSRIDKKLLRAGSTYGNLNLAKNFVVVCFGVWAFILMVESHKYEMIVEQMMATEEAIISGGIADYYEVTFGEAAFDSLLPWIYGFVALFMHWVYTRFQTMIYLTVSFFGGYRSKFNRLTAALRKYRNERRVHLTAIGTLYSRYLSDKSEVTLKYVDFRAPEEIISRVSYQYIEEYLGGKGDDPNQENGYVPQEPVLPTNGHAEHTA